MVETGLAKYAQALRIALEVLWWVLEPEKDLGLELAFLCYF